MPSERGHFPCRSSQKAGSNAGLFFLGELLYKAAVAREPVLTREPD